MEKDKFCMLTQKNQKKMYSIAYQIVRNEADACDAVAEGILHAYERRNAIKDREKFSSWICQIVRNEAINILRRRKKERDIWMRLLYSQQEEDELREELSAVMENLPRDCREEMILFYYCGLSLKEIAEFRQLPLGTVKSRIHRGRKIVREEFRPGEERAHGGAAEGSVELP